MDAVLPLRQGTPVSIPFGPFYDRTDGLTIESGLTPTGADLKLYRGATRVSRTLGIGGGTHIGEGVYHFPLDATDTAQLGPMLAVVDVVDARPVRQWLGVMNAGAFDAHYAAGAIGFPPRDTRDLAPVQHTFKAVHRSVNTVVCQDTLIIAPGETLRIGFDCRSRYILTPGALLASQGTPSMVIANPDVTLTALGHDAHIAKLEIAVAADVEASSVTIMQPITTSAGGDMLILYGLVRIVPVSE